MRKLIFLFFSFILIFSFSAFAYTSYEYTGKNDFVAGTIIFDDDVSFTGFRSILEGFGHPYVADLDGDGEKEIIILDNDNIRLYNGIDLQIENSFDTNSAGDLSRFYIYDIDSNGLEDIIFMNCQDQHINFLEYNGTAFLNEKRFNITDLTFNCEEDKSIIKCDETTNDCLLASYYNVVNGQIYLTMFNETIHGDTISYSENDNLCPPAIMDIHFGDISAIGEPEFEWVLTAFNPDTDGGGFMNARVLILHDTNNNLSVEVMTATTITTTIPAGAGNCATEPFQASVTAPMVFDFDGGFANGFEIVLGVLTGINGNDYETNLYVLNSDGSYQIDYPVVGSAEGFPFSNPIRTNIFSASDDEEVCVLLFAPDSDEMSGTFLNLLCASQMADLFIDHREFYYEITYNYTDFPTIDEGLIHSVDKTFVSINGRDPKEIISSFGIFTPDTSKCNWATGVCDDGLVIQTAFNFRPNSGGDLINPLLVSALPVQFDGTPVSDIILLSETKLYYLDDGFSKRDCGQQTCITNYDVNPCIVPSSSGASSEIGKVNSTVRIIIDTDEVDDDIITCNATIYYGETNHQYLGSQSGIAPQSFTFGGILNSTDSYALMKVDCFETDDTEEVESLELPFAVGVEGVAFGDCASNQNLIPPSEEEIIIAVGGTNVTSNNIDDQVDVILGDSGIGKDIFWIFLTMVAMISPFGFAFADGVRSGSFPDFTLPAVISLVLGFFMIFIGSSIGYFGTSATISFFVVMIIASGTFVYTRLTGARG